MRSLWCNCPRGHLKQSVLQRECFFLNNLKQFYIPGVINNSWPSLVCVELEGQALGVSELGIGASVHLFLKLDSSVAFMRALKSQ